MGLKEIILGAFTGIFLASSNTLASKIEYNQENLWSEGNWGFAVTRHKYRITVESGDDRGDIVRELNILRQIKENNRYACSTKWADIYKQNKDKMKEKRIYPGQVLYYDIERRDPSGVFFSM